MNISKFNSFYYEAAYSASATAYFNQVTSNGGSLTNAEKTYINTFIGALGTDFAEFDRLWIHGLSNSVAARTSLANPTSTMITAVNTPTFTASQGYTGNGTSSYLNTNFIPNTNGVKYTLNSASAGIYLRNINVGTVTDLGSNQTSISSFFQIFADRGASAEVYINDGGTSTGGAITNAKGLTVGQRTASNVQKLIKNGTVITTNASVSTALSAFNVYLLCRNNNGVAQLYSVNQMAMSFIGSGVINQSTLYTATQALGTSIGWAI